MFCVLIYCKLFFFFIWFGFILVWFIFMLIIYWLIYICIFIVIVIGLVNYKKYFGIFGFSFINILINYVILFDVFIKCISLFMIYLVFFCYCINKLFKINFFFYKKFLIVWVCMWLIWIKLFYKLCCWCCLLIVFYVVYVCFW